MSHKHVATMNLVLLPLVGSAMFSDLVASAVGRSGGVRGIGGEKEKENTSKTGYLRHALTTDSRIDLGERAMTFMTHVYGEDSVAQYVEKGVAPYGFFKKFLVEDLQRAYADQIRVQVSRALQRRRKHLRDLAAKDPGAPNVVTKLEQRDCLSGTDKRAKGGAKNSVKAPGLAFMLLQFFVDHVQVLRARVDSALLMQEARRLKDVLLYQGVAGHAMPKLVGQAGVSWFRRWRLSYNISFRATGMQLKVAWRKVVRRVRTELSNIFRLREFWRLLHPGVPMRWLSIDQKPAWFNNAGAGKVKTLAKTGGEAPAIRENFAASRQRYTILTTVPSWDAGSPPPAAILFKGKHGGRILDKITAVRVVPPWLKLQVQENGSYRSADVVEALEWLLPLAATPQDSIIVMLDWYAGHLTPEVEHCIRSRGHVLLLHGGGTTPFIQVNDTHLHANLQRYLTQMETSLCRDIQKDAVAEGGRVVPTLKREDIVGLVSAVWRSINHGKVATKGYRQTGPLMAAEGPVLREDVFRDLVPVMEAIEEPGDLDHVGTTFRDECFAYVRRGFEEGKWTTWADAQLLIDEHDDEDPGVEEGLEAYGAFVQDEGDEEEDEDEEGGEDEGNDDGDEGGGGGAIADPDAFSGAGDPLHGGDGSGDDVVCVSSASGDEDASGDEGARGGDAVCGGLDPASTETEAASSVPMDVARARVVLLEDAKKRGDAALVRRLSQQHRKEDENEKRASSEMARLLMKRAQEDAAAERELVKKARAEKTAAEAALEDKRQATEVAREKAHRARMACLELQMSHRREVQEQKQRGIYDVAYRSWVQSNYPAAVARNLEAHARLQSKEALDNFDNIVKVALKERYFKRPITVPNLWVPDDKCTHKYGTVIEPEGKYHRNVRISAPLEVVVMERYAPPLGGVACPEQALKVLLRLVVPYHADIFCHAVTPIRLLRLNEYIIDKAFLYAVVSISKWLGRKNYPQGLYGQWPPPPPPHIKNLLSAPASSSATAAPCATSSTTEAS